MESNSHTFNYGSTLILIFICHKVGRKTNIGLTPSSVMAAKNNSRNFVFVPVQFSFFDTDSDP